MTTAGQRLVVALEALADALPQVTFPLPVDGALELGNQSLALGNQLRDYLLPRAAQLDAPLLGVVGGSTGAGKSTLVNSLLRAQLTKPGVLRPTTKAPVLVCNPADLEWFRSDAVLPALVRSATPVHDSRALHVVPSDVVPAGLALLDAPDIDSVDDDNRQLSRQLLGAADLWLFVTSGARYADLVGWDVLADAVARNAVIGVVLNRCPPDALEDLRSHLAEMLADRGLSRAKLFAVPETSLSDEGMVAPDLVQPIHDWLWALAAEADARADVALQTLAGSVGALSSQLSGLVEGLERQQSAIDELREDAANAFREAVGRVHQATSDGTMLRGEVLGRWQDFVGTGEFMRGVEQKISAVRDRISGWFTGKEKADEVHVAVSEGLAALVVDHAQQACRDTCEQWQTTRWGAELLAAEPTLERTSPGFEERAARAIRDWQAGILELVSEEGRGKRTKARFLALGTNAIGAALIVTVFAATGGLTAAEVGIAGGASVLAQRLLEGVFGEDAVRRLASRAKADLDARVEGLLATELARFEELLGQVEPEPEAKPQLVAAAEGLDVASRAAFDDLTRPEGF